jgi:hypothetical protein
MRWTVEQLSEYQSRQGNAAVSKPAPKPKLMASEEQEQIALIQRCEVNTAKYPELRLLFAVPNGGKRGKAEAARLKAQGVRAGIPDLMLPVSRRNYHGLFIELKTAVGRVEDAQREWVSALNTLGYYACVARGQEECWRILLWYLGYRDSV